MEDLIEKLISTSNNDNCLVVAKNKNHNYYQDFLNAAKIIQNFSSKKEFERWCKHKMLLSKKPFNHQPFIRSAVEASVVAFFGSKFPKDFGMEKKVNLENNKMDVDCQFISSKYTFNVEVKCSDYTIKEHIDNQDGVKFDTVGEIPDGDETIAKLYEMINEGLISQGKEPMQMHKAKSMKKSFVDHLKGSNLKFNPNSNEYEINILLLGCDDASDIQQWKHHLWSHGGLFTKEYEGMMSREYENIDAVVLTNLYHRHKYYDNIEGNSWTLEDSFNIILPNVHAKNKSNIVKCKGLLYFYNTFPHFSYELSKYSPEVSTGSDPDDLIPDVKDAIQINNFIKSELEEKQGKYYFKRT